MYKTRQQLKTQAKKALHGKWGLALPMVVILLFVSTYSSGTTSTANGPTITISILPLIGQLLSVLLTVGFSNFLLKICCGQKNSAIFQDFFYGFKCFPGKSLLLYALTILYMIPGALIYMIAVSIFTFTIFASANINPLTLLTGNLDTLPVLPLSFLIIYLVVILLLTILFFIYTLYIDSTYSIVYYLLLDYPELSTTAIWRRSAQLMKGNRIRLITLNFSFIGWILLCGLTLGIGILWLMPYMNATSACFYLDLVQVNAAKRQSNPTSDSNPSIDAYSGINKETFQ